MLNHVNTRIDKIEKFVNNKQAQSTATRQAAMDKLIQKRHELIHAQNCIKELKKDLSYIKNHRSLPDELME